MKAKIDDTQLKGTFIKYYAPEGNLPFTATFNETYLFVRDQTTLIDFTGKYEVLFKTEKDTYPAVAILEQNDKGVTGTFWRLSLPARQCGE